jgi:hypothetical protein
MFATFNGQNDSEYQWRKSCKDRTDLHMSTVVHSSTSWSRLPCGKSVVAEYCTVTELIGLAPFKLVDSGRSQVEGVVGFVCGRPLTNVVSTVQPVVGGRGQNTYIHSPKVQIRLVSSIKSKLRPPFPAAWREGAGQGRVKVPRQQEVRLGSRISSKRTMPWAISKNRRTMFKLGKRMNVVCTA